jgi:hypothetical protein
MTNTWTVVKLSGIGGACTRHTCKRHAHSTSSTTCTNTHTAPTCAKHNIRVCKHTHDAQHPDAPAHAHAYACTPYQQGTGKHTAAVHVEAGTYAKEDRISRMAVCSSSKSCTPQGDASHGKGAVRHAINTELGCVQPRLQRYAALCRANSKRQQQSTTYRCTGSSSGKVSGHCDCFQLSGSQPETDKRERTHGKRMLSTWHPHQPMRGR